jgi:hypothetical protein
VESYTERVLSDKPAIIQDNDYLNQIYQQIASDPLPRATLIAVHITDPHVDYLYTPGANADCNEPVCCRPENGLPSDPS